MLDDLPEGEALGLFREQSCCEEPRDWVNYKAQPDTMVIAEGLVRSGNARLYLELLFRQGRRTRIAHLKFSVYAFDQVGRPHRAYQLDIKRWPKPKPDFHLLPHEHMGDARTLLGASEALWGYDEALEHFCRRTNVVFDTRPRNPEVFILKGA